MWLEDKPVFANTMPAMHCHLKTMTCIENHPPKPCRLSAMSDKHGNNPPKPLKWQHFLGRLLTTPRQHLSYLPDLTAFFSTAGMKKPAVAGWLPMR
ncbi:hypothetical protein [Aquitalea pelogenes]|uniref:hypothetical protein n=1 Tax=Aquitalea pelogenes TaxID=1293573 RepID=UPI00128F755C|nr:hypothetical protein [Aquitalea pelogenes]